MSRLGEILRESRGKESRVQFARKLGLSYTFVRAMEHGLRFPSDKVLMEIAQRLELDSEKLLLAAYCDRSPLLAKVLAGRGIEIAAHQPEGAGGEVEEKAEAEEEPSPEGKEPPYQVANRF